MLFILHFLGLRSLGGNWLIEQTHLRKSSSNLFQKREIIFKHLNDNSTTKFESYQYYPHVWPSEVFLFSTDSILGCQWIIILTSNISMWKCTKPAMKNSRCQRRLKNLGSKCQNEPIKTRHFSFLRVWSSICFLLHYL